MPILVLFNLKNKSTAQNWRYMKSLASLLLDYNFFGVDIMIYVKMDTNTTLSCSLAHVGNNYIAKASVQFPGFFVINFVCLINYIIKSPNFSHTHLES